MILQRYYEQKKQKIHEMVYPNRQINTTVRLFNDEVFKNDSLEFPLILFKYNTVEWSTSSEKEYKADVDFSIFIVMQPSFENDYIESFELAYKVDQAILLHPNRSEIEKNKEDLRTGVTDTELVTNSSLKVRERQYTLENEYWEKSNFYIWEINYNTTLIEKAYKKRYTMITNTFFESSDIDNGEKETLLRQDLKKLGYDLDDYYQMQYNGKDLLIYKDINEQLTFNDIKEIQLNNQ
ncbi:hypothetical protein J8281_15070 [Aquimarina sp. U1-2]|uniref:hypothetical protein n=1 Tax=Aquimarina sp. U1-2 TaxID=2823141 RepID=UPI001AED0652|nr:hypothetical protein [Aquimarina sp. U1-2]MBP2833515.1 hypothetical protein [Aquimarina sp. U1-2]